jgi:hypothetical protein
VRDIAAMALAGSMEHLDDELSEQEARECLRHSAEPPTASLTSWSALLRVLYDSLKRSSVVRAGLSGSVRLLAHPPLQCPTPAPAAHKELDIGDSGPGHVRAASF